MNEPRRPIGEDDLQAWVDGRLDEQRTADVAAWLEQHPEEAQALNRDRQHAEALRQRLAPKATEPVPARLRLANLRTARRSRLASVTRACAAGLVLLAAGGAAGWLARGERGVAMPPTMMVTRDAVAAYKTFVVEVNHPVEVRASDEQHLVSWLSKRLGGPLTAPDLKPYGFRLMGGRLLPAGAHQAAMLMYDDDAGTRLTVYVRAGPIGETAFRFRTEGEVATFAWLDNGYGFAVSAATERDRLLPIAEAVYRTLNMETR